MRRLFFLACTLAISLSWFGPVEGAAQSDALSLTPDQKAAVAQAEAYLNDLTSMQARFVQIASNGAYAEGDVFIQRPGKLRFEYDPPHPALLIANGLELLYYDRELKQASFLPLWETPLWFLVREDIRLDRDLMVTAFEEALGTLKITLKDQDNPDGGAVSLIFGANPMTLKQWRIVDPQGVETRVTLLNPRFGLEIEPAMFEYDDLEIDNRLRGVTDR